MRLSQAEHAELAAADQAGLTVAGYVARAALAAAGEQIPPDAHETIVAIFAYRADVARIGRNINQIAASLNAGGAVPPGYLAEATAQLRAVMDHLDGLAMDAGLLIRHHHNQLRKADPQPADPPPRGQDDDEPDWSGGLSDEQIAAIEDF